MSKDKVLRETGILFNAFKNKSKKFYQRNIDTSNLFIVGTNKPRKENKENKENKEVNKLTNSFALPNFKNEKHGEDYC